VGRLGILSWAEPKGTGVQQLLTHNGGRVKGSYLSTKKSTCTHMADDVAGSHTWSDIFAKLRLWGRWLAPTYSPAWAHVSLQALTFIPCSLVMAGLLGFGLQVVMSNTAKSIFKYTQCEGNVFCTSTGCNDAHKVEESNDYLRNQIKLLSSIIIPTETRWRT